MDDELRRAQIQSAYALNDDELGRMLSVIVSEYGVRRGPEHLAEWASCLCMEALDGKLRETILRAQETRAQWALEAEAG